MSRQMLIWIGVAFVAIAAFAAGRMSAPDHAENPTTNRALLRTVSTSSSVVFQESVVTHCCALAGTAFATCGSSQDEDGIVVSFEDAASTPLLGALQPCVPMDRQ
ncbi:hypothetical protein [uncultured Tateyamaria sp.]|uniref:hypothetical protein n=1 Tax=uncultured Tateyamaria sp. TaxID=455651 RepID=UPI0026059414|nr:hypothetical protein [uncultured Tateyamaria sp.]